MGVEGSVPKATKPTAIPCIRTNRDPVEGPTGLPVAQVVPSPNTMFPAGVSTLSGTAFGKVGVNHVRMSYAASRERIQTALDRINDFVAKL